VESQRLNEDNVMTVEPTTNVQQQSSIDDAEDEIPGFGFFIQYPSLRKICVALREADFKRRRAYGRLQKAKGEEWYTLRDESDRLNTLWSDLRSTARNRFRHLHHENEAGMLFEIRDTARELMTAIPAVTSGKIAYSAWMAEYLTWRCFVLDICEMLEEQARALVDQFIQDPRFIAMDKLRDKVRGQRRQRAGYWKQPKIRRAKRAKEQERRDSRTEEQKEAIRKRDRERKAAKRAMAKADDAMYAALLEDPKISQS
jgi:hypothetical protein